MSWPLAAHVTKAIPTAAVVGPSEPVQHMTSGDHLQLLYHFWLFQDMLAGKTPWFHNLYEFNLGDDAARRETGTYYFPFSLFFAVGDWIAGRAFGWNLAGFLSIWSGIALTFALLRRYAIPAPWAWALAGLAASVPYRWFCLAGGSPTGFAMCWPPLLLFGLDLAVRERTWKGGALAGLALLLCAWDDTHAYFFGTALTPVWCLFALLWTDRKPQAKDVVRWVIALSPILLALVVATLTTSNMTGNLKETGIKVRSPQEVLLSSPGAPGLFSHEELGITNHVHLGACLMILLGAGGIAALAGFLTNRSRWRPAVSMVLLGAVFAGIVLLALGFRGWHDGFFFRLARSLVPPYGMIRQPAKIFCLLPTILAVAGGIGLNAIRARSRRPLLTSVLCGLTIAGGFAEYASLVGLRVGVLDTSQQAYAAVVAEAAKRGETPRALVLPLWPGDSHFTSVYQYFASLHRLRLVNGYRPFVPKSYREGFFGDFVSANQGWLTDAQLNDLQKRGIQYLLLHENMMPEKVAPFPVGLTLKRLLNHPRLEPLRQDGSVHGWRILDQPRTVTPVAPGWTNWPPAARWWLAGELPVGAAASVTNDADGAAILRLAAPGAMVTLQRAPQPLYGEDLHLLTRARGTGRLGLPGSPDAAVLASTRWDWIPLPLDSGPHGQRLAWIAQDGALELDQALVTMGIPPTLPPGHSLRLPAPVFFHAGSTDLAGDRVVFDPERDSGGLALYGPRFPFNPGNYEVEVEFTSPATSAALGYWHIEAPEGHLVARYAMKGGQPFRYPFAIADNQPLLLVFVWTGEQRVAIRSITLHRVK